MTTLLTVGAVINVLTIAQVQDPPAAAPVPIGTIQVPLEDAQPILVVSEGNKVVAGAPNLAQQILELDAHIRSQTRNLSAGQLETARDLRDVAARELLRGLAVPDRVTTSISGFALPSEQLSTAAHALNAAQRVASGGADRVPTFITVAGPGWTLSYVPWEAYHGNQSSWQSYTHGESLDIITYAFRMRRTTSGDPQQCVEPVQVWDSPTTKTLTCQ